MSVDLPEPETPVTATSWPSGISTSMPLRLCSLAPRILIAPNVGRASARPIADSGRAEARPTFLPSYTTSPPNSPAPGPRSMMWSAPAMMVGSCSTTITVLPAFFSRRRTASSRSLSRACSPTVGSSITYIVSVSELPSAAARLMRCDSPPESVRVWRSRGRLRRDRRGG